jgi:proline iminopeptidase
MEMMAGRLPAGRYLYCPQGSHLAMYDDQQAYFAGLVGFLHDLDSAGQTEEPRDDLRRSGDI